jgi:DNA-binding transcriptional regulator YdaS (Cro superfamily)
MSDDLHPLIARAIALVGGRQTYLAERLGRPQQYVSKLLNREVPISAETAAAIDRITDGEVSKSQLRPDLWPPAQPVRTGVSAA